MTTFGIQIAFAFTVNTQTLQNDERKKGRDTETIKIACQSHLLCHHYEFKCNEIDRETEILRAKEMEFFIFK